MKNLWPIIASAAHQFEDGYTTTRHLPLFYLDGDAQGITGPEHAKSIATTMLHDILPMGHNVRVSVTTTAHALVV